MRLQSPRKHPVEKGTPEKPVLGTEVETRCRKCRATTKHVVVGKVGSRPTRVRCGTCELEHEYTVTRARRSAEAPAQQLPWEQAIARARGEVTTYSADASYLVGARVSHGSFGEGLVVRIASPTVCEVLFESRTVKLLMKSAPSGFVAPAPRGNVALRRGRRFG